MQDVDNQLQWDGPLEDVTAFLAAVPDLPEVIGGAVRQAIDEVIDTPHTGRWSIDQLSRVEKTYIGTRVEILVGAAIGGPRIGKLDIDIAGHDVDCKWSKNWCGWMIPTHSVGRLCLLVWACDETKELACGLVRANREILTEGENSDHKRTITSAGRDEIRWLVPRAAILPANFFLQLSVEDRTAILSPRGGEDRMFELFRRMPQVVVSRRIVESIGQQKDPTKRARAVRARLNQVGYELLNGQWLEHRKRAQAVGVALHSSDDWACIPLRTD